METSIYQTYHDGTSGKGTLAHVGYETNLPSRLRGFGWINMISAFRYVAITLRKPISLESCMNVASEQGLVGKGDGEDYMISLSPSENEPSGNLLQIMSDRLTVKAYVGNTGTERKVAQFLSAVIRS